MSATSFPSGPRRGLLLMALALSSPLAAWPAETRLKAVASFSILADIAGEVGGPDVQVTALVGADGDAHVFEPTAHHARMLQQADVLVSNGLGFEGWMTRLKQSSGFKGLEVVASTGIKARAFEAHGHGGGHGVAGGKAGHQGGHQHHHHGPSDPHAWQNVANVVIYARNIAEAFATRDPARAAAYRARAAAYGERLQALDARIRAGFAGLPPERRALVTTHDAFGYYADAYGLRMLAARGVSTDAEPSAADIARLVNQVREQRIAAVFLENISDPRLVEQLARETGACVGGRLYSDALSAPGGLAPSYLRLMEYNTQTLFKALSAPACKP